MIVEMLKVFLVSRAEDRKQVLERVRALAMVHVKPVDRQRAVAAEKVATRLKQFKRVSQILNATRPSGERPGLGADAIVEEVLSIQQRAAERQNRLSSLRRELEQLKLWGEVRIEQFKALSEAGVGVWFYAIPDQVPLSDVLKIDAQCVEVLRPLPGKKQLVGVADQRHHPVMPPSAELIERPARDAPTVRRDAQELDAAMKADAARLSALAGVRSVVDEQIAALQDEANWSITEHSALSGEDLFALQGWLPAEEKQRFESQVNQGDLKVAVKFMEATEADQPPTLIKNPAWTKPIDGLFGMLGTTPGYREFDVSEAFMVALPIFSAMLVGDAGYGLLLFLVLLGMYGTFAKILGARFTQLMIITGFLTMVWGLLNGGFFGFNMWTHAPVPVDMSDWSRWLMMLISFTIGAVHLSVAHLWPAVRLYPHPTYLSRVGRAVLIWGMYGVILALVLKTDTVGWYTPFPWLLIIGTCLMIGFAQPRKNKLMQIVMGVADYPLNLLGTFSDVMSYVRLMAVGLASSVLAVNFNDMAFMAGPIAFPFIFVLGHALNISLCLIAIFAHGVRLNMLEFSNNLGMEWTGHPYQPFKKTKDSGELT